MQGNERSRSYFRVGDVNLRPGQKGCRRAVMLKGEGNGGRKEVSEGGSCSKCAQPKSPTHRQFLTSFMSSPS